MNYQIGDHVYINFPDGSETKGEIVAMGSNVHWNMGHSSVTVIYDVKADIAGTEQILYRRSHQMRLDNDFSRPEIGTECVCGAVKVHFPKEPPGHAFFCKLFKPRFI